MNKIVLKIKEILKFLYKYFIKVYIFELKIQKKNKIKNLNYFQLSLKDIKKEKVFETYFKKNVSKLKRFKNSKFIGIKNNELIIASGWQTTKNIDRWFIEEIDTKINVFNCVVLYDFNTNEEYRNKKYYQNLLKYIQNLNLNKKIIIYTTSGNKSSIRAIKAVNFKKKNTLSKVDL